MTTNRKIGLVFVVGLMAGLIPLANTLGKLSALELKYSVAIPIACKDKNALSSALKIMKIPDEFQALSNGRELWRKAKENVISECNGLSEI